MYLYQVYKKRSPKGKGSLELPVTIYAFVGWVSLTF
jgi:hypothetical protein